MVEKYPKKVEFIFAYGVLAHRNGEIPLARPALEKSDSLSPNNYRILNEWGVMERMAVNIARSKALIGHSLAGKPAHQAALRTFRTDEQYSSAAPIFLCLTRLA